MEEVRSGEQIYFLTDSFHTAAEPRQFFALFQFQFVVGIYRFICLKRKQKSRNVQNK